MYFRFIDDVISVYNGPEKATRKRSILKVTQEGQHEFHTAAYTQTDPPGATPDR